MSKKERFYKKIEIISVFFSLVLFGSACAFGLLDKFEYKIYDILLGLTKSPKESEQILLVDIDDTALGTMGDWPWSREVIADQLMTMRELGATTAVFDIEYLSSSRKSINEKLLNEVIENPDGNTDKLKNIYKDNDDYFARTIQFFGNTWLTVNVEDIGQQYTQEDLDYSIARLLYKVEDKNNCMTVQPYSKFSPAHNKFISHAVGAGFTNAEIDSDGSRRRIRVFTNFQDGSVGQLAIAPLIKMVDSESIIRNKRSIILKNSLLPGSEQRKDIKIPLDHNGNMLIHWLDKPFNAVDENGIIDQEKSSFNHNSIYFLWYLNGLENIICENLNALQNLEKYNFTDAAGEPLAYRYYCNTLISDYQNITEYKNYLLDGCDGYDSNSVPFTPQDENEYAQYFGLRRDFFSNVSDFINSTLFDELGDCINENFSLYTDDQLEEIANTFDLIEEIKAEIDTYIGLYNDLKELYEGKFCIIGNTGTATSDLGTTPFNVRYPNIGTHANVINTILQEDFIYPIDWYWGILFSAILTLIILAACKKAKIWVQNTVGILMLITIIVIPCIFMALWNVYIPITGSVLLSLTAYMIVTISKFVSSEKDKAFLQTTFGAYVAPAVVNQIVKDPEIAKLGGKSDTLTALFSDVKTFSRFTEVINNENGEEHGAEKLVATLNGYLGALSDAIMENNGTIDKYVGDEIVSFFGAPVHNENNAFDACVAAIKMREAEDKYNKQHEAELPINPSTGKPYYLHSRIGLNTGNMVVGNMGTEKKLNYTIMGNNVNLASRLEGTNNAYGSWIMCSESTWNAANSGENKGKIVVREFDYVRVINVKKPVRIYGIIGLKDDLLPGRLEAAETFNDGMKWYLKGIETPDAKKDINDIKKAEELFKLADRIYPADESSKVFINRCEQLLSEGLPEKWDGVYVMKSK